MEGLKQNQYDCSIRGTAHRMTADAYTAYSAAFKIPTILFATLVTASSSIFAAMKTQEQWTQIVVALLSVMVLALTSIGTWLSYGEIAVKHVNKAREFEKLVITIKKYRNGTYTAEKLGEKNDKISDEIAMLIGESGYPRLPVKYEREAHKYLDDPTMNAMRIV